MKPSLPDLIEIRSQFVEALLAYFRKLEDRLAENPLLSRFGRSLDDVRIPLRAVPFEPSRELEEIRLRERLRQQATHADDEEERPARRRITAFRGTWFEADDRQPQALQSLATLEPTLEMAVLLGDPGSGKTEWLKFLARTVARDSRVELEKFAKTPSDLPFPVYVRLPELAAALADRELVPKLVETGCLRSGRVLTEKERCAGAIVIKLLEEGLAPRLAPWVFARLNRSRTQGGPPVVLCLDAWDEVRRDQAPLSKCLRALATECNVRVFVTSRVLGYASAPLPVDRSTGSSRPELQLCPFDWSETETFATEFFRGDPARGQMLIGELREKVEVAGMAQNPLMATLLCLSFTSDLGAPLILPARRVDVFDRVMNGLLGAWAAQKMNEPPDAELIAAKRTLLEALAARCFPDEVIGGRPLHHFLWNEQSGFVTRLPDAYPLRRWLSESPDGVVKRLCEDGVLVPCGGPFSTDYTFLHLTFQEYFTAGFLASRANNGRWKDIGLLIDKKAWLPEWEEVIVLLAGQLDDPLPLLRLFSDAKRDDEFRHRLCLAARCLPELSRSGHQKMYGALSTKRTTMTTESDLDRRAVRIAKDVGELYRNHSVQCLRSRMCRGR